MNRTETHRTISTAASAHGLMTPEDIEHARAHGLPEDEVWHIAQQTETSLSGDGLSRLRPILPMLVPGDVRSRGGCQGACTTYGCTQARILECGQRVAAALRNA